MGIRSYILIFVAVVVAVFAELIVNRIDSVLIAFAMLVVLPVAAGAFAGYAALPGKAGCLTVVLSIVAFFATGALIASSPDSSLAEQIISYVVLGALMTIFGLVAYVAMRGATSAGKVRELDEE